MCRIGDETLLRRHDLLEPFQEVIHGINERTHFSGGLAFVQQAQVVTLSVFHFAAQTIQLAATAAGYGACIMDAMDRDALQCVLRLLPEKEIELVLALGRPAEKVELEELVIGGSRAYWRTNDQVHHVPKRRLEDVLIA